MSVAVLDDVDVDPTVAALEHVQSVLDDVDVHPGADLRHALALTERLMARLGAVKLKIIAAADAADISRHSGLPDTASWVSRHTRTAGQSAAGQVTLARELERLPATEEALARGGLSVEHAAVIAQVGRRLPETLDDASRASVEDSLVDLATRMDPATLRQRGRRILDQVASKELAERHHAQTLADEEAAARAKTTLTLRDNHDGTLSGHFTVPTAAGSILRKVLEQMTAPRRAALGATSAQGGGAVTTDWAHRRGLAFVELLEHLPTDHLHTKVAATIVVTVEHRQLLDDLAGAGLDTGDELSPGEARRLACNAGILPAVLDGASQPLDLGRTKRLFSPAQQVALATQHQSCAADGCERPYAWCELHHEQPWSRGGSTDLANAVPLCHWHHQRIHDAAFVHRRQPNGQFTFHRRP